MHSVILIIAAVLVFWLSWRLHRRWLNEVAARRRGLKRAAGSAAARGQSAQERVLRQAARETTARQFGVKF